MKVQAAGPRIPVRIRRRHLPEAQLGRLLRERHRHGRRGRERGRLPRGDRVRQGLHRAGQALARFPVVAEIARAARRPEFTGDKAVDMVSSIAEVFPKAKYLRCTVHFLNGKGKSFCPSCPLAATSPIVAEPSIAL